MEQQKNVGVWIRVSTEDSAKGESPKTHRERARMYAKLHGYTILEFYDLAGISGKTVKDHPEAQRMLFDVGRGHIQGLIFSKLARFARNTRELLDFADYFRSHSANLISIQEAFDTSTPAGRLFFTIIAAMAEWEREEIVERVNTSIDVRAKLGKRVGGKVPFGYRWEGHELKLNEEEAPIRKLIFTLFLQEKRKKTVAKILNERGYTTRGGKKFYDTNVKRWLRDPLSKGLRRSHFTKKVDVDGKRHVEYRDESEWYFHEAPAIVSKEIWQQANDILDEQEKNQTKPLNRKTHIFTRYIYCGCGSRMSVHSGNTHYRCNKKGCNNKIKRSIIESIYKEQLLNYVQNEDNITEYLDTSEVFKRDRKELLKTQIIARDNLKLRVDKVMDLYVQGQIAQEAFNQYYDEPYKQLQKIEMEIELLENQINSFSLQKESIELVMKEANNLYTHWDHLSQPEKRRIVEMITSKICIGLNDEIEINLSRLMPHKPFSELETNGQQKV